MEEREYYVYILSNKQRRLYIGMTNSLVRRVKEHKDAKDPSSFTARYGINRLVYFERFGYVNDALRREKELKGWLRQRKIALIVMQNRTWRDLSEDWGKQVSAFDESKMKLAVRFVRRQNYGDSSPMAQNDTLRE